MTQAVQLALTRHQLRRGQDISTLGVLIGAEKEAEAVWQDWAQAAGWRAVVRETVDGQKEDAPDSAILYIYRTPDGLSETVESAASAPGRRRKGTAEANGAAGDETSNSGPLENRLAQTVEHLCRMLDAADAGQRRRPIALAVSPEAAARFLGDGSFDRARTFFAEGSITLSAGGGSNLVEESPARGTGAEPSLAQSAPSLARHPLRPATVAGFEAVRADLRRVEAGSADAEEIDRARSAAERFLADLLDELPETQGLFELNVRLEFCFGPKRAEVDLLAAGLRLAIEIDGYYHFRDPEGYRRDRRKDALLQRQGYLVLRFLAEDVVVRLEEILEEIRVAVAFRRATRG